MKKLTSQLALVLSLSLAATPVFAGGSNPPPPSNSSTATGYQPIAPVAGGDDGLYAISNGQLQEWDGTTGQEVGYVNIAGAQDVTSGADGTLYVAAQNAAGTSLTISSYNSALQLINSDVATTPQEANQDGTAAINAAPSLTIAGNTMYITNQGWQNSQLQSVGLHTGVVANLGSAQADELQVAQYNGILYVSSYQTGVVATYRASDGSLINQDLITMESYAGEGYGGYIAINNGVLYVDDYNTDTVGSYDVSDVNSATYGQAINPYLINPTGTDYTSGNKFPTSPIFGVGGITFVGSDIWINNAGVATEYDQDGDQIGEVAGLNPNAQFASMGIVPGGEDLATSPDEFNGAGAAPEPRSWVLGAIMLGSLGLLWQRRVALMV